MELIKILSFHEALRFFPKAVEHINHLIHKEKDDWPQFSIVAMNSMVFLAFDPYVDNDGICVWTGKQWNKVMSIDGDILYNHN